MTSEQLIAKIDAGIHDLYKYRGRVLQETNEKMNVPFSRNEDDNIIIIRPFDDVKKTLWSCFSETIDHDIADYIAFKVIGNEVICFIFELKKRRTISSSSKVNKQIHSTFPLVKMIFEKTTGINAKNLKTIGIKVFGTGTKSQSKLSRVEKRVMPNELAKEDHNLLIAQFEQNLKDAPLMSLNNLYNESKRLFLN